MSTYTHLLVGLDLSEDSPTVLKKAAALAQACSAKLSVAHVVEPLAFAYGGEMAMDMSAAQSSIEEQAMSRLKRLATEQESSIESITVKVGQTSSELHYLAEDIGADLLVVGSHGRHGFALLLGSTANGVLHGAKTDVLAVRV